MTTRESFPILSLFEFFIESIGSSSFPFLIIGYSPTFASLLCAGCEKNQLKIQKQSFFSLKILKKGRKKILRERGNNELYIISSNARQSFRERERSLSSNNIYTFLLFKSLSFFSLVFIYIVNLLFRLPFVTSRIVSPQFLYGVICDSTIVGEISFFALLSLISHN